MYEKEFKQILDASQNNALSFFFVSGISAVSGGLTWKALIHAICDKLGRDKKSEYSSDEYLQIPQMYYYSLGENKDQYYEFVEAQLNPSALVPNVFHREMLNLNPASFITTNYDTLIEDAAIQYCQGFKVVCCDEDVPNISGDRFILKLHGDFKHHNFVLKEEDYLNYSENFKLIETLVKSIFSTNTVVFIGYSLNDYNIKLILNWTKSLLKNKFREPIFIYTGDRILSHEDVLYQKSKGLSVIEWNKINPSACDYSVRYQSVFDAIKNKSRFSINGKTEDEAFETLYNLLKPLDRLVALRVEDVSKKLSPYVWLGQDGVIRLIQEDSPLMKKFLCLTQMAENEITLLPAETAEQYRCVLNVFKKARISTIIADHKVMRFIDGELPFSDKTCILFDYKSMYAYSNKEYEPIRKKYKKAFYLSRLQQYEKAFFLFSEVAKQAFKEGDYLLYYLAESNCISLHTAIKNTNKWYRCYDLSKVEAISPTNTEADNLFRRLPVEFRNTYESLNDIHSANMLYKYSYEAFVDGQKLQNAVESSSIELGLSSSGKVICRINDYLHFLMGNGIIADMFTEYKNTVKNLMSLLVYKYSTQKKVVLHDQLFPTTGQDDVFFDEIDFYCFIECFTDKEIIALFKKYQIETIEFRNMDLVEIAVENLINSYQYAVKKTDNFLMIIHLQTRIKRSLALIRFMAISQNLVDRICDYILAHEFREIMIDDKVLFLDSQLYHRNMISGATAKIVENTLISYLDQHISALKKKEKFELNSAHAGINYCNLVHYIAPQDENYSSRKLSLRISKILNANLSEMYPHIMRHYCGYISDYQKKRLIAKANKDIIESFNFDLFTMLVKLDARINPTAKAKLKGYLKQKLDLLKQDNSSNGIGVYPVRQQYEELEQVGYWCLINVLDTKDFDEFLGYSPKFDFYCQYTNFDFSKLQVSWLLNLKPYALDQLSKDIKVKETIRSVIACELNKKDIATCDKQRLSEILVKHFC